MQSKEAQWIRCALLYYKSLVLFILSNNEFYKISPHLRPTQNNKIYVFINSTTFKISYIKGKRSSKPYREHLFKERRWGKIPNMLLTTRNLKCHLICYSLYMGKTELKTGVKARSKKKQGKKERKIQWVREEQIGRGSGRDRMRYRLTYIEREASSSVFFSDITVIIFLHSVVSLGFEFNHVSRRQFLICWIHWSFFL